MIWCSQEREGQTDRQPENIKPPGTAVRSEEAYKMLNLITVHSRAHGDLLKMCCVLLRVKKRYNMKRQQIFTPQTLFGKFLKTSATSYLLIA